MLYLHDLGLVKCLLLFSTSISLSQNPIWLPLPKHKHFFITDFFALVVLFLVMIFTQMLNGHFILQFSMQLLLP